MSPAARTALEIVLSIVMVGSGVLWAWWHATRPRPLNPQPKPAEDLPAAPPWADLTQQPEPGDGLDLPWDGQPEQAAPWWLERCACGHLWGAHDVDEYRGDGTETCCVEGCPQQGCPGRDAFAAICRSMPDLDACLADIWRGNQPEEIR